MDYPDSESGFPLTPSLSPGERENGPLPLDQTHAGVCQRPSAKYQPDASCSLSLRVRGKYAVANPTCSLSKRLLSSTTVRQCTRHQKGAHANCTNCSNCGASSDNS